MKNVTIKNIIKTLLVIAIFLLYLFVIGCPIRFIFGITCPGCGLTRAMLSVLHLDFEKALYYHPLWSLFIVLILLNVLKEFGVHRYRASFSYSVIFVNIINVLIGIIFILVYIYRIAHNNPVVLFDIKDGFLYQYLSNFIEFNFEFRILY